MIKHFIFLAVFGSFSLSIGSAQEAVESPKPYRYLSIGILPNYLLDPITPSIGLSVEHNIGYHWHIEYMYGYDPNLVISRLHPDPASRHHEYRIAGKFFLESKASRHVYPYLGVDYFGTIDRYTRTDGWFQEGVQFFDFDSARVTRKINGGRFFYGIKYNYGTGLYFDILSAIGMRWVQTDYDPENILNRRFDGGQPFTYDKRAGLEKTIAFMIGIKIEYRFLWP